MPQLRSKPLSILCLPKFLNATWLIMSLSCLAQMEPLIVQQTAMTTTNLIHAGCWWMEEEIMVIKEDPLLCLHNLMSLSIVPSSEMPHPHDLCRVGLRRLGIWMTLWSESYPYLAHTWNAAWIIMSPILTTLSTMTWVIIILRSTTTRIITYVGNTWVEEGAEDSEDAPSLNPHDLMSSLTIHGFRVIHPNDWCAWKYE